MPDGLPDDSGNDADTLAVALLNAPSQLDAALSNFDTILSMLAPGDPQRAIISSTLTAANYRITTLLQSV